MAAHFNDGVIKEFRENHGNLSGMFAGMKLLLLTTTGAKSGEKRVTPVAYTKDGNDHVIIASFGGAPNHPAWFHNLVAHPEVTVEVGDETFAATAHVAEDPDHDRLYAAQASQYPVFLEYQKKTDRKIPVVVLKRNA